MHSSLPACTLPRLPACTLPRLPACTLPQLTARTLLLAGIYCCWIHRRSPSESWVQGCPRPGFQTRSPGKPGASYLKSQILVYLTTGVYPSEQDTPCMRFSLSIGHVCETLKFYMHLYAISGLYQPPDGPTLCSHSPRLWSWSVFGASFRSMPISPHISACQAGLFLVSYSMGGRFCDVGFEALFIG